METNNQQQGGRDRVAAAIAAFVFFAPMLMGTKTEFSLFYAKQSFVMLLAIILVGFVPFFGGIAGVLMGFVNLWCAYQAYQGIKFPIPLVSEYMNTIIDKLGLSKFFSV